MPRIDPARRDALPAGTSLREYTLESVVGHGGFGIVYRAQHGELGATVAVKEYLPVELAMREGECVRVRSDTDSSIYQDGLRRFRDEARALMQFQNHQGIVSCRDFFRANGTAYMVMDYEDGPSLAEVLATREAAGRPFGQADLLGVMVPLLDGLERVHEAGLLHRDIKPSNILIRRTDERPVLIDFGAAKQDMAGRTKSMAPYTEGYAAMEQVADSGALGPWTDMYGVGAVMWRIVAGGKPPWQPLHPTRVESRSHAVVGASEDPMPTAAQLGKGRFTRSVLDGIDGCLRLQEGRRIQNCRELLGALQAKRTDPEDLPFGRRFPVLNKFTRTRLRDVLRTEWMPVRWRVLFGWALARSVGLALPIRLMRDLRPPEQILSRGILAAVVDRDSTAQYCIGKQYSSGNEMREDYIEAVWWYRKAAKQGHEDAQCRLGDLYCFGLGVSRDYTAAAEWYRRAAEQGHREAQGMLGGLYRMGKGVAQDDGEATEWFQRAANQGHEDAEYLLGLQLPHELAVEHNDTETEDSSPQKVKQGSWQSQCRLAFLYLRRLDVSHSRSEYFGNIVKKGCVEANYELGQTYYMGSHVAKDHAEAAEWYRRAAELGHAGAQHALGKYHCSAIEWQSRKNRMGVAEFSHTPGRFRRTEYATDEAWTSIPENQDGYGEPKYRETDDTALTKWYRRAAEQGHMESQARLAKIYELGLYEVERDAIESIKWYRRAAEQGHVDSQCYLGFVYKSGTEVDKDYIEAARWYRRAAEQGDSGAQYSLGSLYEENGESQDYVEALKWYCRAAEQGHRRAQDKLLSLYQWREEVADDGKLVEWLQRLADQGDRRSQDKLADPTLQAVKNYWKAAEKGDLESQYNLANCYEAHGRFSIYKNYVNAAKWYRRAAEQGHLESQSRLGWIYSAGQGVKQDYVESLKWYHRAAEQGHYWSQRKLGDVYNPCFIEDYGVGKDLAEAARWYQRAARHDQLEPEWARGSLRYDLGQIYEEDGVSQDYAEAARWYRKAAGQGHCEAQYRLGLLYHRGRGVERDLAEAANWYRKAVERGLESQRGRIRYGLGQIYEEDGALQDYTEAVRWYRKAADLGSLDPQHLLGCFYFWGRGISKDHANAARWYREAAERRLFPT